MGDKNTEKVVELGVSEEEERLRNTNEREAKERRAASKRERKQRMDDRLEDARRKGQRESSAGKAIQARNKEI